MKTVRFAELVAKSGKPEPHQLWSAPGRDRLFQRALKEHRVLTIHQKNVGTKKDFGVVGFHEEPHAQFVIFPQSIREFDGRRVIGINYDLLEQPAMTFAAPATSERVNRAAKRARTETAPSARERHLTAAHRGAPSAAATSAPAKTPKAVERPSRTKPTQEKVEAVAPARAARAKLATPAKSGPSLNPSIAGEITRAMKELKGGKAVAAYERLQRLVAVSAER